MSIQFDPTQVNSTSQENQEKFSSDKTQNFEEIKKTLEVFSQNMQTFQKKIEDSYQKLEGKIDQLQKDVKKLRKDPAPVIVVGCLPPIEQIIPTIENFIQNEKYIDALEFINKCLQMEYLKKLWGNILSQKVRVLDLMGKTYDAIDILKNELQNNSFQPNILATLVQLHIRYLNKIKKFEEAKKIAIERKELFDNPLISSPVKALLLIESSQTYNRLGCSREQIDFFKKQYQKIGTISLDLSLVGELLKEGSLLAFNGEDFVFLDQLAVTADIYEIDTNQKGLICYLNAKAYIKKNEFSQAINEAEKGLRKQPKDQNIRYELTITKAQALLKNSQFTEVCNLLKKLLKENILSDTTKAQCYELLAEAKWYLKDQKKTYWYLQKVEALSIPSQNKFRSYLLKANFLNQEENFARALEELNKISKPPSILQGHIERQVQIATEGLSKKRKEPPTELDSKSNKK